jgi:kynurenine formamidase
MGGLFFGHRHTPNMIDLTLPMAEGMGGFPGYPPVKFERL